MPHSCVCNEKYDMIGHRKEIEDGIIFVNTKEDRLYEKLSGYGKSDYYGFHMPGHKRNRDFLNNELPYGIDITEIDGFDDLHHAKEILKLAQERAANVYHAEETCYLINGSTSGLLSAILGCTHRGEQILVARNCHKSVYAAMQMNELKAGYIYPEYDVETGLNGEIDPKVVRAMLEEAKEPYQAVVITSPTYDGVVSDVEAIAKVAHEYQIPLIIDEAHGAHFGFHPGFPANSNQKGADLVIHSLHKTLPALTQTALIHMNGNLISREKVKKYVHMLQTSSPSYVLMASMDECIRFLEEDRDAFVRYYNRLDCLRNELAGLKHLKLVKTQNYDPSKIVISTKGTNYNGKQLYEELLETYHLQMEMASREYILAMTTVCDTEDGMERLQKALFEIDEKCEPKEKGQTKIGGRLPVLEQFCTSAKADTYREKPNAMESVRLEESEGRVSLEYAYGYPPGIPILVPGERISREVIQLLKTYESMGFDIEGWKQTGLVEVLKK